MRFSVLGRFTIVAALATGLAGLQALADGSLSALPNVGASQALNASQKFSVGGGPPMGGASSGKGAQGALHDQSGTLTITRIANDSARLASSDGLDAFDQTLRVDARGAIAQPSPANPFIDALDTVTAVLAAAPANPQKAAAWSVSVTAPSWINSFMNGALPKSLSSIPVNVTVASATGDTLSLRGEGKGEFKMATGMGDQTNTISIALDCTLRSGQIKSCSRMTSLGLNLGPTNYGFGETTALAAK
jgi:hypothetical protein